MKIQSFKILEIFEQSLTKTLCRAESYNNQQHLIVKILKEQELSKKQYSLLQYEFNILKELSEVEAVARPVSLEKIQNNWYLSLQDFAGESLAALQKIKKIELLEFLKIAISLTKTLEQIHSHNIIHCALNPANILFNSDTDQIKLIDFGLSRKLDNQQEFSTAVEFFESNPAYISPEQTGRMNRLVDYRSDFYSLGIIFYEMLTGISPFAGASLSETVHHHIAINPIAVQQIDPNIPKVISDLVMKLLTKMPENRYQSAFGLKYDLQHCLELLIETGEIEPFEIGLKDRADRFTLGSRLYGREEEIEAIQKICNRIVSKTPELLLVYGEPGIGKTSLIKEIEKIVTEQKGYFLSGKFEQYRRNDPYSAFIEAFQDLIEQLLMLSEETIITWREKILVAVGSNAQLVVDIIPKLELIIGQQNSPISIGPAEAQSRFKLVIQQFINVFTQSESAFVLFFDDLQWADLASLELIELLLATKQNLLIIGAYRNNEVSPTHPLSLNLENIKRANIQVNTIEIKALDLKSINELLSDTLLTKQVSEFGQLCLKKTQGNPFFLNQFLKSLYQDGYIAFDSNQQSFVWDLQELQKANITDNVVDLMISKINKFSQSSQELIKVASCIGNRFDLNTIAMITEKSPSNAAIELFEPIQEGLIYPLNGNYQISLLLQEDEKISFKFLHDRVQQSAFTLITEDEKKVIHLKIGEYILNSTKNLTEDIFNIVNHLNQAAELINRPQARKQLASLNLLAAKKAQASSAFADALKYLTRGIAIFPGDLWQDDYDLAFELYRNQAECEYLVGNFENAQQLFDILLNNAQTQLERADIQAIRLALYDNSAKYIEALEIATAALKELDIHVPNTAQEILENLQYELQIYHNHIGNLDIAAPKMSDPIKLVAMQILFYMAGPAYFTNPELLALVILKMVNLSIKHGNSEVAACAYACWANIVGVMLGDYKSGYEIGKLALRLSEQYNNPRVACRTMNMVGAQVAIWHEPIAQAIDTLRRGFHYGVEVADIYGCYSATNLTVQRLASGDELSSILEDLQVFLDFTKKLRSDMFAGAHLLHQGFIYNLQGLTKDPYSLSTSEFDETLVLQIWQDNLFNSGICGYLTIKVQLYFLYGDYQSALDTADQSKELLVYLPGQIVQTEHCFYHCLAITALFSSFSEQQSLIYREILEKNQALLKFWSENCAANFLHKSLLVEAEIARISGDDLAAIELYEQAIESARQNGFTQNAALANELAAQLYLARNNEKIAKIYLQAAYYYYQQWGAWRKLEYLKAKYARFLLPTLTTSSSSTNDVLDLATVIKASQALAAEIVLENLVDKLIQIVLENAGGQTGFLLLLRDDQLLIEAKMVADGNRFIKQAVINSQLEQQLPLTLINYVVRNNQYVLLINASIEGRFIQDPYIQKNQIKSILCTPIIYQNKFLGLLYLENNLLSGAFTPERLEIVSLISAQAAISLQNAQLYQEIGNKNLDLELAQNELIKYNKTLEQKVTERTQELSQTLEVLKATQAELIFENELLKSNEKSNFDYQVGGALAIDSPTYVVRSADRQFYQYLKQGQFCYILNPRQMGKSSLMVRMISQLQKEGIRCGAIDMSHIGSWDVTPEQWYLSIAHELIRRFGLLKKIKFKSWWNEHSYLSPLKRLGELIEDIILVEVTDNDGTPAKQIIIFIDEIDSILSLNFPVNEFFALIRSCYNQRSINPEYRRLTFALLGVVSPSDLIADVQITPFNIGRSIQLQGFKENEIQPLLYGLLTNLENPQTIFKEILFWSNGQPFLTQKICNLIRNAQAHQSSIENIVRTNIINNWESQDEPEHLKTISNRLIKSKRSKALLQLYRRILDQEEIYDTDSPEASELILTGLVIKQESGFKVSNRIYEAIFNHRWLEIVCSY